MPSSIIPSLGGVLCRWNEYDDAEIDGAITGDAVAPLRRFARNFLLNKTSELFIYGVIIFAGVASSLEPLVATQGWQNSVVFYVVEYVILAIFAMECMMKMCAESAGKWYAYFQDSWNTFDFSITLVLMVMTPFGNAEVSVGRLLRLLRAVRLVRGAKMFPKLIIVSGHSHAAPRRVENAVCLSGATADCSCERDGRTAENSSSPNNPFCLAGARCSVHECVPRVCLLQLTAAPAAVHNDIAMTPVLDDMRASVK